MYARHRFPRYGHKNVRVKEDAIQRSAFRRTFVRDGVGVEPQFLNVAPHIGVVVGTSVVEQKLRKASRCIHLNRREL